MRPTTILVAGGWLVQGILYAAAGVSQLPPVAKDGSWAYVGQSVLGIVAILGGVDLLRRRTLGWWMVAGVNALALAVWGWGIVRTYGVHEGRDGIQDLMAAMIAVFLAVGLIALVLDRPSKWRLSTKPEAEG